VRNSGEGKHKNDPPTEFSKAFPQLAGTSPPDKEKKEAGAHGDRDETKGELRF
jgi:hypothetical protein